MAEIRTDVMVLYDVIAANIEAVAEWGAELEGVEILKGK